MKKHTTAILAAFAITLCVGMGMLLVSGSAYLNKNGLPVADSPAAATATAVVTTAQEAQIQQLQGLVDQYQAREVKYQSELSQASQKLQQANQQVQQYQLLMVALQNRGVIRVDENGRVFLP